MKSQKIIEKIYDGGGVFVGGFVRDALIRGTRFYDVDFYFDCPPEWIRKWPFWGKAWRENVDGISFHCQKVPFDWDLSCNFFNYSKSRGLFAKPTTSLFSYDLAYKMILRMDFAYLHLKSANLKIKMLQRGWRNVCNDFRKRKYSSAPYGGCWDKDQSSIRSRMLDSFLP